MLYGVCIFSSMWTRVESIHCQLNPYCLYLGIMAGESCLFKLSDVAANKEEEWGISVFRFYIHI